MVFTVALRIENLHQPECTAAHRSNKHNQVNRDIPVSVWPVHPHPSPCVTLYTRSTDTFYLFYFSTKLVREDWHITCTTDWTWRTYCTHFESLKSSYVKQICFLQILIPYSPNYLKSQGNKHNECFSSLRDVALNKTLDAAKTVWQDGIYFATMCFFLFNVCVVIWQTYI